MSRSYSADRVIDKNFLQWLPDSFSAGFLGGQLLDGRQETLPNNLPGPPPDLSLEKAFDHIDIWRVDLSNSKLDTCQTILSMDEKQRADKFIFDKDRDDYVRSRCSLRLILARCLSYPADKIVFQYGEHGRPELEVPAVDDFQFNLSHSGHMALIVVSRGRNVGIDLNYLDQNQQWQPIAKRSFSSTEQALLFRLPEALQETMFYRIWSQKEAYTKAFGDGFSYGFQNFTVAVDVNGTTGLLADTRRPQFVDDWMIVNIDAGEDWIAALAYNSKHSKVSIRQWEFHDGGG